MTAKRSKSTHSAPDLVIALDGSKEQSLTQQLYRQVREHIVSGLLKPDDALPPSRALAGQLRVSRMVVVQAYERLLSEGYITAVSGSGTYVSRIAQGMLACDANQASEDRPGNIFRVKELLAVRPQTPPADSKATVRYDFRHGVPAWDQFPMECWRKLWVRVWSEADSAVLGYGPAEGSVALRNEIARLLRHTRGIQASADRIVITTGATQALSLLSTVLLSHHDIVVVEDPAHPVLRDIFRLAGALVVPVPIDEHGLCVRKITRCLAASEQGKSNGTKTRLIYVTPAHQFPTGVEMSPERKGELLAWANRHDAIVVEDDYDSEYRYDGTKTPALASLDQDSRVIYVGSFSKVLFPALRVGFAYLPRHLVEPFLTAKWLSDRLTPTIEQEVLAEFIQTSNYAAHVRHMTRTYRTRRLAMVNALRNEFGERVVLRGVNAGLHIFVEIDSAASEAEITKFADLLGVRVYPASPYYLHDNPTRPSFLLGYGALSEKQIKAGVAALGCAERLAASQTPRT